MMLSAASGTKGAPDGAVLVYDSIRGEIAFYCSRLLGRSFIALGTNRHLEIVASYSQTAAASSFRKRRGLSPYSSSVQEEDGISPE